MNITPRYTPPPIVGEKADETKTSTDGAKITADEGSIIIPPHILAQLEEQKQSLTVELDQAHEELNNLNAVHQYVFGATADLTAPPLAGSGSSNRYSSAGVDDILQFCKGLNINMLFLQVGQLTVDLQSVNLQVNVANADALNKLLQKVNDFRQLMSKLDMVFEQSRSLYNNKEAAEAAKKKEPASPVPSLSTIVTTGDNPTDAGKIEKVLGGATGWPYLTNPGGWTFPEGEIPKEIADQITTVSGGKKVLTIGFINDQYNKLAQALDGIFQSTTPFVEQYKGQSNSTTSVHGFDDILKRISDQINARQTQLTQQAQTIMSSTDAFFSLVKDVSPQLQTHFFNG